MPRIGRGFPSKPRRWGYRNRSAVPLWYTIYPDAIGSPSWVGPPLFAPHGTKNPVLYVELGTAGSAFWVSDDNITWESLSDRVRRMSVSVSRSRETGEFEPGRLSLTLSNEDAELTPEHPGSSLYPHIVPNRQIRVRWSHNAVISELVRGFADSWTEKYDSQSPNDAVVDLQATDGFKVLAATEIPSLLNTLYSALSPTAWFKLDEPSGTTVHDAVRGSIGDGSYVGTVSLQITGLAPGETPAPYVEAARTYAPFARVNQHVYGATFFGSGGDGTRVGIIEAFGGTVPPEGSLICDGTAVSRTTYSQLFGVIGESYGVGDGSTTFNIPDARGKVLVAQTTSGTFNLVGDTGGAETVTLTEGQLAAHNHSGPSHTHTQPSHTHSQPTHTHSMSHTHSHSHEPSDGSAFVSSPSGGSTANIDTVGGGSYQIAGATDTDATASSASNTGADGNDTTGSGGNDTTGSGGTGNTGNTGGGVAHDNLPPFLVIGGAIIWYQDNLKREVAA